MNYNDRDLQLFASMPERRDHVGFLKKMGEGNKSLKDRWCVLKGNFLFYYKSQQDASPVGFVFLEQCTVEPIIDQDISGNHIAFGFEIAFESMRRKYNLATKNEAEMNSWISAIRNSSYASLLEKVKALEKEKRELLQSAKEEVRQLAKERKEKKKSEKHLSRIKSKGENAPGPLSEFDKLSLDTSNASKQTPVSVEESPASDSVTSSVSSLASFSSSRSSSMTQPSTAMSPSIPGFDAVLPPPIISIGVPSEQS